MSKNISIIFAIVSLLVFFVVGCDSNNGLEVSRVNIGICHDETLIGLDEEGIAEKTRGKKGVDFFQIGLTNSQVSSLGLDRGATIYTKFSLKKINESTVESSPCIPSSFTEETLKDMKVAIDKIGNFVNSSNWILIPDDILYQHKGIKYVVRIGPKVFYFYDDDGDGKVDRIVDQYGRSYTWEEYMDYFISSASGE